MSKKNQVYLMILAALLLALSTLFALPVKLVLLLTVLLTVLFVWAALLLLQARMTLLQRLGLFLLLIVFLSAVSGLWLVENRLLLVAPQSRYFLAHDQFARTVYDGLYFSVSSFTHLGSCELMPANHSARAIALIISLAGYLGLAFLLILLQRGLKREE